MTLNIPKIKMIQCILTVFFITILSLLPALADDVTDSINDALEQYKKGEYASAMGSLNYASQLIGQKKGETLEAVLPEPLPGWNTEKSGSQAAGAALFGGGITAEKTFIKADSNVSLSIVTDSPVLQGLMMMFSNPMFAGANGGKLEKINGQKAIINYDEANRSGEIKIIIANRFLVTSQGNNVDLKDLKDYIGAIDFNKLASLP